MSTPASDSHPHDSHPHDSHVGDSTGHDHAPHGEPGHVHDQACAAAHGDVQLAPDQRRLVLVFASPVAAEMAVLAERLGWPVALVDPDPARLEAAHLEAALPPSAGAFGSIADAGLDAGCDVVVCDHERTELGDVLADALAGPTRWVGVMGSLRHTAPHVAALQERGLADDVIARVHRPIGLDVGSRTPAEIALSTVAGLLADRNGKRGGPFPDPPATTTPHA